MLFGRFQRAADAVPALLNVLHGYSQMPKLIRVEGADGIGKSTGIAEPLASELRAKHLDTDKFRCDPGEWTTYIETVRVEAFQNAVREELEAERQVVADSVCLDEVLPESTFGKGFRIYVMQLEPYHDSFWQWGGLVSSATPRVSPTS